MYVNSPHKQMLTQQQKNNRRKRASPSQLAFLRKSFMLDPKPDQDTREAIGRQIDMTPRSVQIWFQNNRAKSKQQEKRLQAVCNLPLKTSRCGGNVSRVHVDLNAVNDYRGNYFQGRFYQHTDSSVSAPIIPTSSEHMKRRATRYRGSYNHQENYQNNLQYSLGNTNTNFNLNLTPNCNSDFNSNYFHINGMPYSLQDTLSESASDGSSYCSPRNIDHRSSTPDFDSSNIDFDSIFLPNDRDFIAFDEPQQKCHEPPYQHTLSGSLYGESEDSPQVIDPLIERDDHVDIDSLISTDEVDKPSSFTSSSKPEFSIF